MKAQWSLLLIGLVLADSFSRLVERDTKTHMAVGQKWGPKMGCPGKWKYGLRPAVPWWFYFDPYPYC